MLSRNTKLSDGAPSDSLVLRVNCLLFFHCVSVYVYQV